MAASCKIHHGEGSASWINLAVKSIEIEPFNYTIINDQCFNDIGLDFIALDSK